MGYKFHCCGLRIQQMARASLLLLVVKRLPIPLVVVTRVDNESNCHNQNRHFHNQLNPHCHKYHSFGHWMMALGLKAVPQDGA
jgi:hypothetical protein